MANKEKKRNRSYIPHDYVVIKDFLCESNGRNRWFNKNDIVWDSEYEKLSGENKKKCKSLPPKDVLIKEKVKREKEENKVKIETKGFDFVKSFRKGK